MSVKYGTFNVKLSSFDEYTYFFHAAARNHKAAIRAVLEHDELKDETDIVKIIVTEVQVLPVKEKYVTFDGRKHVSEL